MASRRARLITCLMVALTIVLSGCRDGPADKTHGENTRFGSQTATPTNGRPS
jgi:hypothetical protein